MTMRLRSDETKNGIRNDGTRIYGNKRKNGRLIKWIIDILDGDVLSTNEIMEALKDMKMTHNNNPPKYLPSVNKLVSILYANPEFTRVNAKTERPALWRLR